MLLHVDIRNFALIEQISMEPGSGLLILTGETGAGKSILIDAIGALAGGRVSRDLVRHGCDAASVEALFRVEKSSLPGDYSDLTGELEADEDGRVELVLSREMTAAGRSICRINGRMTTLGNLRSLSSSLFDIHGQHDQQAIFQVATHLQFLDRYGGQGIKDGKDKYMRWLGQYKSCVKALKALGSDPSERARRIDLLAYQINEIEEARLQLDEEQKLVERQKILAHAEKIQESLAEAYERLSGDGAEAVLEQIAQTISALSGVSRHSESIEALEASLCEIQDTLQTTTGDIRSLLETLDIDPNEIDQVNHRLDQLYRLKKKYGGSIEHVLAYLEDARDQLDRLNGGEARYESLLREKEDLRNKLLEAAKRLSAQRKTVAKQMELAIACALKDLGMKTVQFAVRFEPISEETERFPEQGLDQVAFELSANPGEPLKPLAQIASGGEASRIMLAIKTILSDADPIPVLIFDEIDTGISGETAGKVGQKLMQLARKRQVLCITHMAQIASMADEHWLIEKQLKSGRTQTCLSKLSDSERFIELARLLSGGVADETARSLAAQLKQEADHVRNALSPE